MFDIQFDDFVACFSLQQLSKTNIMFFFHCRLFARNFLKHRLYSFINVSGLAVGFAVFILIGLYVMNEYSYDRFTTKYDRITRLEMHDWCVIPAGVSHILEGHIPEVEHYARTMMAGSSLFTFHIDTLSGLRKDINLPKGLFVDSTFLSMFEFGMVYGDPGTALDEPMTAVLTRSASERLFGDANPVNKVVKLDNRSNIRITGVIEEGQKTHFDFEYLLSMTSLRQFRGDEVLENLSNWNYLTYLQCIPGYDQDLLKEKVFRFLQDYEAYSAIDEKSSIDVLTLRPLKQIYFDRHLSYEAGVRHGNRSLVDAFIIIAIFILLIAGINFINLTTARAGSRAKEVGVKKVIGINRKSLNVQFLTESVLLSIFSMLIAFLLVDLLIPEFNSIAGTDFSTGAVVGSGGILLMFLLALAIGLISGLYPAWYLSGFNSLQVLKGSITRGKGGSYFRKVLIVVQFVIAAILISGTLIVNSQVGMLRDKDKGFEGANVVNVIMEGDLRQSADDFRHRLLGSPHIQSVSFSHGIPGYTRNTSTFTWKDEPVEMRITSADPYFFDLYEIELIAGRYFDETLESDKRRTCLINESAAKVIGWDDPLGQVVHKGGDSNSYFMAPDFRVIGVFRDYHIESLHVPVVPLAMFWDERVHWQGSIRFAEGHREEGIKVLEEEWMRIVPDFPFTYSFIDDRFDQMYQAEDRLLQIAIYFSVLSILIACLGLFGLSAFMASLRNKEIGIRKVLGSSVTAIIMKFLREYSVLVMISNAIAIPLGWYIMDNWLDDYPFRIDIPCEAFLMSFVMTIGIALFTVSFHSYLAASRNPVSTLRYE